MTPPRVLRGDLGDRHIETRHPIGFEISLPTALDFLGQPRTQVLDRKLHRLEPHPMRDVFPVNDEVVAAGIFTPHQEVEMRVIGVVVRDAEPLKLRAQVRFHWLTSSRAWSFNSSADPASGETMKRK
jgi:hypothetical protein